MTEVIDTKLVRQELVVFLRNQNIFTTTQRGVTTQSDTGTFASDSSHTLATAPTTARNVRSIVIASVTKKLGTDYTVDYTTGVITFTSAQTGDYTISYDTGGTPKVYPDFPRDDLKISAFPRIGLDIITIPSSAGGLGNVNVSDISFTVVVYDKKSEDISDYITAIRTAFITAQTSFYYMGIYVKPTSIGPILKSPREKGKDKILQQNIDFVSKFKYETN